MPKIIELESSLNINQDIETIEKCCSRLGELYKYFKQDEQYEMSEAELKATYVAIIKTNQRTIDNSKSPEERKHFIDFNDIITEAYNILSDANLRKIYDEQFFKKLSEQEKQKFQQLQNQRILEMVKYGFLFFSYPPIELITRQFSKFESNSTLSSIVKSIYKQGSVTSLMVRPLVIENVFATLFVVIDEIALGGVIGAKLSQEPLKFVASASVYSLLMYPLKFFTNVISVAPFSMSSIQVIKKIILREDQGNGLQFKNFFHAFLPSLFLYGASKLIKISLKELQMKIQEKEKENPNSKIYKNLSLLVCNKITSTLITTALNWPLFMLRYQYSNEFVQSYLSGLPIPIVINPISMAIKVYKQYGLKKFYTGALSMGLISSFASISNNLDAGTSLIFDN
ncbi:hypothetical protein ACTFIY_001455 [Dictyostelium cf. discoideum]